MATGAAVSVLAATAALSQPWPWLRPGLLVAAVLIGVGTGLITPLASLALAAVSPPERLGQTMGSAEIGRELGDAGGPLLVGALATAATLAAGFLGLAVALALAAGAVACTPPRSRRP